MTTAPGRLPLAFGDLDDVAAAIREGGGRLTAARRAVLEALFAADGPASAEYIARGLDGQLVGSDLSSVYRNLERLEELGVVRHLHVGHGPGLYALDDGGERGYLVCERCARVTGVSAARLDGVRAQIRAAFGYDARFEHFPIVGLCRACSAGDEVRRGRVAGTRRPRSDRHGPAPPHGEHDHEHQHSHRDRVHSHPHVHRAGLAEGHEHTH